MRQTLAAPAQLTKLVIIMLALVAGACGAPAREAAAPVGDTAGATVAREPVSPSALAEVDAEDEASESGAMNMEMDQTGSDDTGASEPIDHSDPDHVHDTIAAPFAADTFGGSGDDYGAAFAADGQTVFFTRAIGGASREAIYFSRRRADGWGEPEAAPFSGAFHDKEPYLSPDGSRLYFASTRPVAGGGAREDLDLFYVQRDGDDWGEPVHLAATSTPFNEDYPAVAADGTLVFSRNDGDDNLDLWIAHAAAGGLEAPRPFDRPINSVYAEADAWISSDARTIVFSTPRIGPDAQGQGDLYVIHRRDDGWTPPRTLGFDVNTVAHEYGPVLSPDGATFYFARGFGGELWSVPVTALANFEPG